MVGIILHGCFISTCSEFLLSVPNVFFFLFLLVLVFQGHLGYIKNSWIFTFLPWVLKLLPCCCFWKSPFCWTTLGSLQILNWKSLTEINLRLAHSVSTFPSSPRASDVQRQIIFHFCKTSTAYFKYLFSFIVLCFLLWRAVIQILTVGLFSITNTFFLVLLRISFSIEFPFFWLCLCFSLTHLSF